MTYSVGLLRFRSSFELLVTSLQCLKLQNVNVQTGVTRIYEASLGKSVFFTDTLYVEHQIQVKSLNIHFVTTWNAVLEGRAGLNPK